MRRVILAPGEQFTNAQLKRPSAFNPQALAAATDIIERVRERGDAALREFTERFDGVAVESFRVPQSAIDEARSQVDPATAAALEQAAAQIREFHERQLQQSWFAVREDGALTGAKVSPLESVGIYVPGGRALYPSTVLMNALPAFVAGVGTGGTISGVGRYLKEQNPAIRIVAMEPASSPLLTEGHAGPHAIQGIGANFVPEALDTTVYDEVVTVTDEAALASMHELAEKEGLLCGVSSGAAAYAARELAKRPEFAGRNVVCLLPDTGERYLSIM